MSIHLNFNVNVVLALLVLCVLVRYALEARKR